MSEEFESLLEAANSLRPGESFTVPKASMPELPPEFEPTVWGTPLWIAHPGSTAQFRAPEALHAYEIGPDWEIHRDRYDPKTEPVGHFFLDAPELPIATAFAALAGIFSYWVLDRWDERKTAEDGRERSPWVRGLVAAGIAVIVFIVVYVLAALARVGLGVH